MRSVTSFFNATVLRKDISRFSPIWASYGLLLALVVTTVLGAGNEVLRAFRINELLSFTSYVNGIYAGIVAMVLFGDLYDIRMCNALHAMPLRREGWFLTHCASALLFSVVPTALACLFLIPALGSFWYLAIVAFGVTTLQYIFFFGLAAFSALCVGKRLALIMVYSITNAISMLFMWLCKVFYQPILYGILLREGMFRYFCPFLEMGTDKYANLVYEAGSAQFMGLEMDSWGYLIVCTVLGLGFAALALVIYRRRSLESAQNFIAVRPLAPVFLALYTLTIMAVMYAVSSMFFRNQAVWFLIGGLLVGFLSGQMLLSKSVRVFRPRLILGFAAMMAVFAAVLGVLWLDPIGLINYVPNTNNIQTVEIATSNMIYYEQFQADSDALVLTQPEDIQAIVDLHHRMIENQEENAKMEDDFTVYLEYHLSDGTTVWRNYPISLATEEGQQLKGYFSSWQCVLKTEDFDAFAASVTGIQTAGGLQIPASQFSTVLQALKSDCDAGTMAQTWNLYDFAPAQERLTITFTDGETEQTLSLRVYSFSEYTLEALAKIAG